MIIRKSNDNEILHKRTYKTNEISEYSRIKDSVEKYA